MLNVHSVYQADTSVHAVYHDLRVRACVRVCVCVFYQADTSVHAVYHDLRVYVCVCVCVCYSFNFSVQYFSFLLLLFPRAQ